MLTIGHTFHLPWLTLSVFSWSVIYFLLRHLEPQRKAEWHCRIVTVIHASLITVLSGWCSLIQGPWTFTEAGGPNTPLQVVVVTICLGYFFFDFTWCLYFQTEGFPMLLHHFLSIVGMLVMLVAGQYGTEMVATICGSEVTNPLLQLRWFLKETGRYKTWAGEIVDFLFMTSFFTIRIIIGSVLLYCYFQQPTDFWGRLGAICIYLIGWMFLVSIFQYAVFKYSKKYRAWQEGQHSKAAKMDQQNLLNEDNETSDLSESVCSTEEEFSPKKESYEDVHKQSFSSNVSQNGVFHRSNGQSFSKGAVHHPNVVTSSKDSEQR